MNLTKTSWPGGWNPSNDPVNGDPNSLCRMDNLQQEESGALGIVKGQKQLTGSLPDYPYSLYSTTLGGQEPVYAGLNIASRAVVRSLKGDFSDTVTIATDGGFIPCFGSALGEVLVSTGSVLVKDDGTTVRNLGLTDQASAPVVTPGPVATIDLGHAVDNIDTDFSQGSWSVLSGSVGSVFGTKVFYVDPVTLLGSVLFTYNNPIDSTGFPTGTSDNFLTDVINFLTQLDNSNSFSSLQLQVILDGIPETAVNYYTYTWDVQGGAFNLGETQQSTVGTQRQNFVRMGTTTKSLEGNTLDWTHVTALKFTYTATALDWFLIDVMQVTGGPQGNLYGLYQYLTVAIYDNGLYQAKSAVSPISSNNLVLNTFTTIPLVATDPQANQVWVFRQSQVSSTNPIFQNFITVQQIPALLNDFYLVGVGAPGDIFTDNIPDNFALEQNIRANRFLVSLQDLNDNLVCMEGLYYDRMLYVSESSIYLSDPLNPDAIDSRFTIKAFDGNTEKNLWLKKIGTNQLVLATTRDHYLFTGTLEALPSTGQVDITITPIGEKYPSLSGDFAFANGLIFYPAADGIRATNGGQSTIISPQLQLLWRGNSRFGVPGIFIGSQNSVSYGMCIAHNNLYVSVPMTDGTRRVIIYDSVRQIFRMLFTDPISMCSTPSDKILVGYGEPGEGIWLLEAPETAGEVSLSGTTGFPFTFQTVFDANGQPRNRKDTFTLKIISDCGGSQCDIYISKDSDDPINSYTLVGSMSNTGQQTNYYPLNNFTLGFRYSIKIVDHAGVTVFKLYELTIEYEPRPEQLDYMRVLPTNLGSIARKRFTAYAFVIDTLGNQISFTPFVDNTPLTPQSFSTGTKLTQILYFLSETIGTDIGGIFSGGVFEFYQVAIEECVSEKLPTPVEFLVIPANDYGVPNRKRHTSYKFQILTRGQNVLFTPILDGISYTPAIFNTTTKRTVEYFFPIGDGDIIGIDIGGTLASLASTPFEFYGVISPQQIEKLPDRLEYFVIPPNDYGTPNRKRHSSFKFQINTNGNAVLFTPIIDTISQTPAQFITSGKQTVEYFFLSDTIGIDIGGILQSVPFEGNTLAFEFYQVVVPQQVEVLPPRLEFYKTPNTNFGVAARKRIRTIPIVIDTYGSPVTFTPIVDGILQPSTTTLQCFGKTTLYHYFSNDVFGTDYGGTFESQVLGQPFEFYEYGQPADVEVLPVPKKYDQLGPARFDKIGKLFGFRLRLIMTGTTQSLPYKIFGDLSPTDPTYANPLYSNVIPVVPGVDGVYEVQFPKNVNTDVVRLVLGPTSDPFHRYDTYIKMQSSGMESDSQWIPIK